MLPVSSAQHLCGGKGFGSEHNKDTSRQPRSVSYCNLTSLSIANFVPRPAHLTTERLDRGTTSERYW